MDLELKNIIESIVNSEDSYLLQKIDFISLKIFFIRSSVMCLKSVSMCTNFDVNTPAQENSKLNETSQLVLIDLLLCIAGLMHRQM